MNRIFKLLILINLLIPAVAQVSVKPITNPHVTFVDGSGLPCALCKLYTYAAGTTTPLATYMDASGTSQNPNPIVLDAAGGANIWTGPNSYKFLLESAGGSTIWTVDQVNYLTLQVNGTSNGSQTLLNLVNGANISITGSGGNVTIAATGVVTTNPSASQTVIQPNATSLNVNIINNVEDASLFSGSDIGAKINAAFAACPATQSCKVTLPPGNNYSYSTMFTVPGTLQYTELDCQGSALTFTGSGDASQVAQRNDADPTGAINNCRFVNGSGNTTSLAAVHQFSRAWFAYNNNTFSNFNNAGGVGIELENNAGSGWPGYNERTHFNGNSFSFDAKGIQFRVSSGTSSFARQIMLGTACNLTDGQICLSIEGTGSFQTGDLYGAFLDIHANVSGTTVRPRIISLTNGGDIRLGMANIEGEGAGAVGGYLLYIADSNSLYQMSGAINNGGNLTNFNGATSDAISNSPNGINFTFQGAAFSNGTEQSTNSKFIFDGANYRIGMPLDFATPHGSFQLYSRVTTNNTDPEVDATPSTGNIQKNLMYCDPRGCGFGTGYGLGATTGGTNIPTHNLEFNDTFGNQAGNYGTDADGTTYAAGLNINMHANGAVINTSGFGYNWNHLLSTTDTSDFLVLNTNTPSSSFHKQVMIIDAAGDVTIPLIKATTGTRYVCVDTTGKLVSQSSSCSGT